MHYKRRGDIHTVLLVVVERCTITTTEYVQYITYMLVYVYYMTSTACDVYVLITTESMSSRLRIPLLLCTQRLYPSVG